MVAEGGFAGMEVPTERGTTAAELMTQGLVAEADELMASVVMAVISVMAVMRAMVAVSVVHGKYRSRAPGRPS